MHLIQLKTSSLVTRYTLQKQIIGYFVSIRLIMYISSSHRLQLIPFGMACVITLEYAGIDHHEQGNKTEST
jgi:hypothetical protein